MKLENRPFTPEEFEEITGELEVYHEVFYTLWTLGRPYFSDSIDTACVSFDKKGDCISFLVNPNYWATLSKEKKAFIICHECLHVILLHGKKAKDAFQKPLDRELLNFAMDVCVNHLLVKKFFFSRESIDPKNELCWVDTVFKKDIPPKDDDCFEYYFNLLKKDCKVISVGGINVVIGDGGKGGGGSKPKTVDNHEGLFAEGEDEADASGETPMDKFLEKVAGQLHPDNGNSLWDSIKGQIESSNQGGRQAGTTAGNVWKKFVAKYNPKKKWETVIKEWVSKRIKNDFKNMEQWARIHRRFSGFLRASNNTMFLPTEMEEEARVEKKDKLEVWFFLDTSGSCAGLAERFWTAANSLPKERFIVNLYCFDTKVYPVENGTLRGFGGTAFNIIEEYIQEDMKKHNKKYPEAVFLITDGYGNPVNPQMPKRWYWFLSHQYKYYIPKDSHVFDLCNFE